MNKQLFLLGTILFCGLTMIPLSSIAESKTDEYEGCGDTVEEAMLNLGRNIDSQVKSEATSQQQVAGKSWLGIFSLDAMTESFSSSSSVKSDMQLCGISTIEKNGQQCAVVKRSALERCAKNKLSAQLRYTENNLPAGNQKLSTANQWLNEIGSSRRLYQFVGDALAKNDLSKLDGIEKKLRTIINKQFVSFNIAGENIKILIDDKIKATPNKAIELEIGEHSYNITAKGYCPISDKFELGLHESETINIDLIDYRFPELTFSSNYSGVSVTASGEKRNLGSTVIIDKCDGLLNYAFTFEGNTQSGSIDLQPGMKKEIRETFVSKEDMQRNRNLVRHYEKSTLWQVHYQHFLLNRQPNGIESLSGLKLSKNTLKQALRSGYELIYAQDDDNNFAVEFNGKIELQLVNFGKNDSPLHIGSVVFIPHIGLDIGLGYHELNDKTSFENPNSSNWEKFYKSYVVARPNIGVDLPISKDIGLSFGYGRSLYMNESDVFSAGINVRTSL